MIRDLRLGFVVSPDWALDAVARAKQLSDGYCSSASQHALAAFISEGHLARHVRRMRAVYALRRATLVRSLKDNCGAWLQPLPAMAGLHIAAAFREHDRTSELILAAAEEGIGLRNIAEFAVGADAPKGVILGYGCTAEDVIASAMIKLGKVCSRLKR